ncbi:MAG TPA: GDP-mannose 4,6-dehydratase [Xanthobacteraceae bacterium]|nr:GDP-mannose 4,6-dehydratase [Xanthobacteraceae bacterium]
MKVALICGVSGQDGSLLAKLLLDKQYRVFGTSRDAQAATLANLKRLDIVDKITLESMNLMDFRSILQVLARTEPDEIYNLSGPSSVGLSFQQPLETMDSIGLGTINLLEAVRFIGRKVRIYNASSSECFGDIGDAAATEDMPFSPRSPYGVAKATSHWLMTNYRQAYGLFACNGILFNHESPLRPERFVTKKVVAAAARIARGSEERLTLGALAIRRDWGWAPEYVDAMWRILQCDEPDDFVVATGESHSLEEFVQEAFTHWSLDWREHVTSDSEQHRPLDILSNRGDAAKASRLLGWQARHRMKDVVLLMAEDRLDTLR